MKLSRVIAMTAAVSITAGVFYNVGRAADVNTAKSSSIFGDIDGDGMVTPLDASILLSYYAYLSTVVGDPMPLEDYLIYGSSGTVPPSNPDDPDHPIDPSVKTGGDTFTIAHWSPDDVPYLIAQWKGLDYQTISEDLANGNIYGVEFISFGVGGGEASERYDQIFAAGDDLDVYFCEADWGRKYIEDDSRTLDLSKLGLNDNDFVNMYSYTDEIGKDSQGYRKGVSWECWAGAYAYRADLAEEYLGASTPEEMQAFVNDWDGFVSAAAVVSEKSGGSVAMADSLPGMLRPFFCGKTTPWVMEDKLLLGDNVNNFADKAKQLWETGGVSHNAQWSYDWTQAGVDGEIMGYFVPTWGLDNFFLEASGGYNGAQYGKWAMCEGPQPYYWGGSWILVNPKTDNGEEARDFILSAVSDEAQMQEYALNKPEFVNNRNVMKRLISSNTVFDSTITDNFMYDQNIYNIFNNNAQSVDLKGLITPYDSDVESLIAQGVQLYCEGYYTWDEIEQKIYTAFENGDDSIY